MNQKAKNRNPFQFFSYQKGNLSAENIPLSQIAKEVGTPAYVYVAQGFLDPLLEIKSGLQGLDHLICFAVKANSNLAILELLSSQGAGVDIVSGGELYRAQKAGVPAQRIVFSGVGKTDLEMKKAIEYQNQGILSFNVESLEELYALNQVAVQLRQKARIALRFNPDVDAKTHPYISTGLKKNKFGMTRSEILKIMYKLEELPGINLQGISIHIGSQLMSLRPLDDAFSKLKTLTEQINSYLLTPLSFVDVGGGVGISYKNENPPLIKKYCELIHKHFGKKSALKSPLKILLEPGRLLSGNAGVLLTRVTYSKQSPKRTFLIVDAAMNDLLRPALYESYHEIVPTIQPPKNSKKAKVDVVGPVCESSDCFATNRPLPGPPKAGDLMAILSAGAYGFSMASTYNSRPRPPEVLVADGAFRLIRIREGHDDLIRGELMGTQNSVDLK